MKKFLLYWTEYFSVKGHKCSHSYQMNITTTSIKRYMTYKGYDKQPVHMVEMNFNTIISQNPHLKNALDSVNHPLIRKSSVKVEFNPFFNLKTFYFIMTNNCLTMYCYNILIPLAASSSYIIFKHNSCEIPTLKFFFIKKIFIVSFCNL